MCKRKGPERVLRLRVRGQTDGVAVVPGESLERRLEERNVTGPGDAREVRARRLIAVREPERDAVETVEVFERRVKTARPKILPVLSRKRRDHCQAASSPIIGTDTLHVYCVYPFSGSLLFTGADMVNPAATAAADSAMDGSASAYQFMV